MKIKISIFLLICFVLMGCPSGHFYEYKAISNDIISTEENLYSRFELTKELTIYIRAGFYYEFINQKESGLAVIIKVEKDNDLYIDTIINNVKSSYFGDLKKVDHLPYTVTILETATTLKYNLVLKGKNRKQTIEKLKKDTISIELKNGEIWNFTYNNLE